MSALHYSCQIVPQLARVSEVIKFLFWNPAGIILRRLVGTNPTRGTRLVYSIASNLFENFHSLILRYVFVDVDCVSTQVCNTNIFVFDEFSEIFE